MKSAFTQFIQTNKFLHIVIFVVFVLLAATALIKPTQATNSRVVTIFADGTERTISTGAENVAEALEKAEVTLDEQDLVEPSLDAKITDTVYRVNVYRARPVTVIDGEKKETVVSPYQSARLIASEAGIKVYQEDEFMLEQVDDIITTGSIGQRLIIDRAKVVNLNLYGKKLTLRTQAETVEQLLSEKEIILAKGETLKPKPATVITDDMSVFIAKVGTKIVTEEVEVPFEEEIIQDSSLPVGTRQVKEAGVLGQKAITYELVLTNGKETGRKKLHEVVVTKPVKQVVVVGTAGVTSGTNGDVWAALRQCESGGNYANKNNPTYRGAYQFSFGTWAAMGGSGDPADASPAEQDLRARILQERSGWGQWPACSAKLGL